jgi:hypothetical protein
VLPVPSVPAQVQPVYKGQITELRIAPQPNAYYYWALYRDSSINFAGKAGVCKSEEAWFTDSISNQPTIHVKWNSTGLFFYKILIINTQGCTNFKIGTIRVLGSPLNAPKPDVRIFPNPSFDEFLIFQIILAEESTVTIDLFSTSGQLISRIFNDYLDEGELKTIRYKNNLSQGVYLYQVRTDNQMCRGKITVIRRY